MKTSLPSFSFLRQAGDQKFLLLAAALFAAAFAFSRVEAGLEVRRDLARQDYSTDLELSKNGDKHRAVYSEILNKTPLPSGKRLERNEWIRTTQDMINRHNLLLSELAPSEESGQEILALEFEGTMTDVAGFLYELKDSAGWTYVSNLEVTRQDGENTVRASVKLSQK
ncbi:MAG TPA: hypothetical protein VL688_11400 [Verrucomicrobiae bacterium]|nr:hypothetical protein [Verrucomicrobiae bacterium]